MAKLKYKVLLKTDAMFLTRVLISILILISTLAPASLSTTCSTTVIPANCDLITLYNVFTGINSNINRNLYEGYGITTPVAPPATNQQNWLNNNCLLDLLNTNNTSGFPPLIIAANNGIYYNKTPTQTAVQLFLACGANPDTIVNYPPKFMDATALDWVIIHFNSATPGTIDYQTDQATIAALLPPVTTCRTASTICLYNQDCCQTPELLQCDTSTCPIPLNGTCNTTPPNNNCAVGTSCDSSTNQCKIKIGNSCYNSSSDCVTGAICSNGPGINTKICTASSLK